MTAEDLMNRQVLSVSPDLPLPELDELLLEAGVGGAPVVAGGKLVGLVSRSDIVKQASVAQSIAGYLEDEPSSAMHAGRAPGGPESPNERAQRERILGGRFADARVKDAMTDRVVSVPPQATLREVARVISEEKVHRVLVTRGSELLGVISALDIVRLVADGRLTPAG